MSNEASKLFHIIYPTKNFYAASAKKQRRFSDAAKEFEQYLEEQKRDKN
jgi:hypothetical protein